MTPATISSGLVPNPPLSTPFIPPLRTDWDILFQPLFDELLTPSPSVDLPAPVVIALIAEVVVERISKKRTKNKAKTTKSDTEWKSVEKTKSSQSPSLKKSTKVNPDKSKVKK
ncbi:hypothetical protein Tco_0113481 [Tanacetum coccineum]